MERREEVFRGSNESKVSVLYFIVFLLSLSRANWLTKVPYFTGTLSF